ncbi:RagB/SusD family nutrient uptake outer membrane protein [uncultured Bacteroides sp.]|uniref:RagB/SusD family nutrient uptake outer membrane protein n=1 Tax=uncultured Bacteroides sp. TaxID=162156 RepID=UPI00258D2BAB|nr:RagB/SusD family nutrient uptake outer membrane protein [uncultured Bacteroides sp.]
MKNIKNIFIGAVGLLIGLSSCSDDFLKEKRDYNRMITVDVFSDKTQASAVFATIYKQILSRYNSPLCGSDPLMRQAQSTGGNQHVFSEEMTGWKGGNYSGAITKTVKAGNHIGNPPYWNDPRNNTNNFNNYNRYTLFPTVYLINNYIIEIDRSRSLIVDDEFWNHLKGQAMFARAWLYFDATREWGGFPYYCTEVDMPEMNDRSLRMPIQECIDKICADFENAAKLLPAKWDGDNYGRFTSVAALAMSARARVFMASPIFNANWDDTSSKRWQAALDASLAALAAADAAGYGTNVTDIESWDKAFYNYNGAFNPESIITVLMNDESMVSGTFNKWEDKIRPSAIAYNDGAGIPAPDEVLKAFPMKDGKSAIVENGYDDDKFYRNRDPRFYRTFAFSGCEWPGIANKQLWLFAYKFSDSDGNMYRYTDGKKGDGGAQGKSRAIVWKMSNPNILQGAESTSGTDIMEYRYGELLLNVAECYAAQGKASECLQYLGRIRSRVGISNTNNYGLGNISDRYQLIKAVLNERQIELAYEGKRSWDLKRWLLFEGGAGFDPNIGGGYNSASGKYDPVASWGAGWKIYDGKDGRPEYSRANNVLTKLGMEPLSGTKHTSKIWGYDLDNVHAVPEYIDSEVNHPLVDNELLKAVPGIKRSMNEADRNAAFDKLEAFCDGVGMKTYDPIEKMGHKYGMESGSKETDQNFLFAWRGWYYIYPIHYDMYDPAKGNSWIEQTAGWMIENRTPSCLTVDEQNGTYYYCTPEE